MAQKMPQREMVLHEMQMEVHGMTIDECKNVMQKYTDTDSGISPVVAEAHNLAIASLEAWQKVLDELGDINRDIYTDEVKEIINRHLQGVGS